MRQCGHRHRLPMTAETVGCDVEALPGISYCDEHARLKRDRLAEQVQQLTRAIMLKATGGRHGA